MSNPFIMSALVGVGGFFGAISRYGLSLAGQRLMIDWPIGTLAANILGCLFIGIIAELSIRTESLSPMLRLALATGFCGGFTTMSSMMYETAQMLRSSELLHALLYALGTFILSLAGVVAGSALVRALIR